MQHFVETNPEAVSVVVNSISPCYKYHLLVFNAGIAFSSSVQLPVAAFDDCTVRNPSSTLISPPPDRPFAPVNRARELVQQFKQARADPTTATEKRRAIRQQAKTDGVHSHFQALLQRPTPNPELKCSERT
jgi:hypothetical protein